MFEAWRLNKQRLYDILPLDTQLHVFFIFTGDKIPEYITVEAAVIKGIEKLMELYTKPADA